MNPLLWGNNLERPLGAGAGVFQQVWMATTDSTVDNPIWMNPNQLQDLLLNNPALPVQYILMCIPVWSPAVHYFEAIGDGVVLTTNIGNAHVGDGTDLLRLVRDAKLDALYECYIVPVHMLEEGATAMSMPVKLTTPDLICVHEVVRSTNDGIAIIPMKVNMFEVDTSGMVTHLEWSSNTDNPYCFSQCQAFALQNWWKAAVSSVCPLWWRPRWAPELVTKDTYNVYFCGNIDLPSVEPKSGE